MGHHIILLRRLLFKCWERNHSHEVHLLLNADGLVKPKLNVVMALRHIRISYLMILYMCEFT